MDILFVHNNFPGQFAHLARHFLAEGGHRVFAISGETASGLPGVSHLRYRVSVAPPEGIHAFAARFDSESRRAEGVLRAALALRERGANPAVIYVHPGWGENLPLRDVFPFARIIVFCEFFYRSAGADVGFDPEFPANDLGRQVRLRAKNAAQLLALADADAAIAPTRWQQSLYPEAFANRISVVHDGIDTEALAPGPPERFRLPGGDVINPGDEIVTFVSRSLEPYRGYHAFMRSLPEIMAKRPQARIVIVGAQGVSYGASAPDGQSWRDIYLNEVRSELDESRIIFTGHLAYAVFVALLRHSSAHVYLTYPFVLSWSMLEAMSLGCLVIGSATPPVQEVIQDGDNGLLVPFFDRRALAESVIAACATPERYQAVRAAARRTAIERYDLRSICLPRQLEILRG